MSDDARAVWVAMRALVLDNERRDAVAQALEMSYVRVKALLAVVDEPRTMRQIADYLRVDPPYVTLIVADLEERGLVTRGADPSDRRVKRVTATPAGAREAARADAIIADPPASLLALSDGDLRALRTALENAEDPA